MPKIYTKTGDKGLTGLIGGKRVWKDSLRIETYGTVDELNCVLGVTLGFVQNGKTPRKIKSKLVPILQKIQNELFNLGCELANPNQSLKKNLPKITNTELTDLENLINQLEKNLSPLRQFILPGGLPISGLLHHARSVCRRAERRSVELSKKEFVAPMVIRYLNRLSDTLFVLARWAQRSLGGKEILWQPKKS
jgi:cob(I)alamin adenosyltransferase